MPIFQIEDQTLFTISQDTFDREKELQTLIEKNLGPVFNCRFVASEFSTGAVHAGRIDTLALSEENHPVIIEYKKVKSSELINQSLFYLHWLQDHQGDFEIAVQHAIGPDVEVDWADIRVICIAPNYKRYDIHAVQVMGANIELWKYRLFENSTLYLEEVYQASVASSPSMRHDGKNPVMVEAGKKAAITRATATYTFDEHLEGKPEEIQDLTLAVQEFVVNLDPSIEEVPKKHYIAYKGSQNIICVQVQKRRVLLHLKLEPKTLGQLPDTARDVTDIGHYGTGDLELSVSTEEELAVAKPFIEKAYQKVGG
ncbi:DUF5655 domain-containing protein [Salisaeta longa]|uniref:DUF5655 domain-containing protein n=1 Tax=Salisaeta longa TaxID=503170 RepID=UPI0003B528D7|nr:DUF5655 domain-containing protein [Salisaeta longa]